VAGDDRFDAVVVGGGILGLATAAELLRRRPDWSVVVFEKERELAAHQTGRNSGVIHTGIYYAAGSLKAQLCREGRELLFSFCDEEGIPYEVCGKVVVAVDDRERAALSRSRSSSGGAPQTGSSWSGSTADACASSSHTVRGTMHSTFPAPGSSTFAGSPLRSRAASKAPAAGSRPVPPCWASTRPPRPCV
jgi:hypothetical protein